jgi:TATA-binding protein-associated factor Taf7
LGPVWNDLVQWNKTEEEVGGGEEGGGGGGGGVGGKEEGREGEGGGGEEEEDEEEEEEEEQQQQQQQQQQLGFETGQSLSSNDEVKKAWTFNSVPSPVLRLCLFNHKICFPLPHIS